MLWPHSSKVLGLILSSGYCPCGVFNVHSFVCVGFLMVLTKVSSHCPKHAGDTKLTLLVSSCALGVFEVPGVPSTVHLCLPHIFSLCRIYMKPNDVLTNSDSNFHNSKMAATAL